LGEQSCRRLKCEKFTDEQWLPNDGKSSHGPSPGELKIILTGLQQNGINFQMQLK